MKRTVLLVVAMLVFAAAVMADEAIPTPTKKTPKPNTQKTIDTEMDIRLDANAKEATLYIPRSQIKQLRAELEGLDDSEDTTAGITRTQTLMSGMFMSLAIVFGGMWFVRSGKAATKGAKVAVIGLAVGAIATAATFVYANAGPPDEARSITGKMFSQAVHIYGFGWGRVKLAVSDDARIRLVVPNPKENKPNTEE